MPRLNWQRYALKLAETAALRSEDPYQQVGACALNEEHMVLGLGYNGLATGTTIEGDWFWEDRDYRRAYMIHAETNCLSLCRKGEVKLLAVTLLPCSYCATMIASYGVPEVVYKEEYERDAEAHKIFKFYNITLTQLC